MADPVGPVVVKKTVEVWELQSRYAAAGGSNHTREFMDTGVSNIHYEGGGEDQAYDVAAHIMLSEKHYHWYNDHEKSERWEYLKERLARWLKWHDKIRKDYVK